MEGGRGGELELIRERGRRGGLGLMGEGGWLGGGGGDATNCRWVGVSWKCVCVFNTLMGAVCVYRLRGVN